MSVRASPPLDGELLRDAASRTRVADDFGHIVRRAPYGVLVPRSADDIAGAIRWCAEQGMTFAARGRGHSTFGRSQAPDGVVADMSGLGGIGPVDGQRVAVGAGATWREVLAATLPHGKTPPVVPDHLGLSVGGTLVVGGIGAMTSKFGAVSDNVTELEIVTGQGVVTVCSATRDADIFDAVRAGLGQVAVITRATLRLVPAPRAVRRFQLVYSDLTTMVSDARRLLAEGRCDAVQGAIVVLPDGALSFRIEAAVAFDERPPDDDALLMNATPVHRAATTVSYLDYLDRLAALDDALHANGQWSFPHPWLMTFVGDRAVESVVSAELDALHPPADLGPLGQVALSPIRRSAIASPLLRMPSDDLCFALNLVRIPGTGDPGEAARLVAANTAAYRRIRAGGGTLYPVSALRLSPREWRDHFGPAMRKLETAKGTLAPHTTLTPGYEIFG